MQLKTKIFFSIAIIVVLIAIVFAIGHSSPETSASLQPDNSRELSTATQEGSSTDVLPDSMYKKAAVTTKNRRFEALVSDTEALREKGLGGREGLLPNQAMLFVFDAPDASGFWMKDMKFSIDILWLDELGRVISFFSNVAPETFPNVFFPARPAKYVLEFSAGTVASLGLGENDTVTIEK